MLIRSYQSCTRPCMALVGKMQNHLFPRKKISLPLSLSTRSPLSPSSSIFHTLSIPNLSSPLLSSSHTYHHHYPNLLPCKNPNSRHTHRGFARKKRFPFLFWRQRLFLVSDMIRDLCGKRIVGNKEIFLSIRKKCGLGTLFLLPP